MKLWIVLLLSCVCTVSYSQRFVQQKSGQFYLDQKQYKYIGTNYWYGSFLALNKDAVKGILRLRKELDFLKAKGVTNLRVLGGAEGSGRILGNYRVGPPLQPVKAVFDTSVLYGLDILLDEMGKRDMKAVVYFSNNWEWSGGFLQYLNWNGIISDSVLQNKMEWDTMRDIISKFYSCEPCKSDYLKQVNVLLRRTNSINGKKYIDDPTIMSWQIANEPRPMRPSANVDFTNWIKGVAAYIKSIDSNHMVSTGSEGNIATDDTLFNTIHADKNIDYLTIHIWPKNWGWINAVDDTSLQKARSLTKYYIGAHSLAAFELKKPLVIEEFGFPRDSMQFAAGTSTFYRDRYYDLVFSMATKDSWLNISGINFWAFNGQARPVKDQILWKPDDDYMGDPPMEQQSLYGVYDCDTSTWKVIDKYVRQLRLKANRR
jgi:mannan endo-1,4-beta-mannosidase